jgi:hypothetical protein
MWWTFTSFIHDNCRPYLYFMQNLTMMNIKKKECQYEAVTIPDPYQGLSMHFIILPWPVLPPWGLAYVIANSDHKQEKHNDKPNWKLWFLTRSRRDWECRRSCFSWRHASTASWYLLYILASCKDPNLIVNTACMNNLYTSSTWGPQSCILYNNTVNPIKEKVDNWMGASNWLLGLSCKPHGETSFEWNPKP